MRELATRHRLATLATAVLLLLSLSVPLLGVTSSETEKVAFNTVSLKYHCLDCEWARKCTKNCIVISAAEARKRGGVPCKVCGGSCE
jgi:hypothetical protein